MRPSVSRILPGTRCSTGAVFRDPARGAGRRLFRTLLRVAGAAALIPVAAAAQTEAPGGQAAPHHPAAAHHGSTTHSAAAHKAASGHPKRPPSHGTTAHPAGAHHPAPAHPGSRSGTHPGPRHPVAPHPAPAPAPVPVPVPAPEVPAAPTKGSNTGLPLPRYAALRADEVNLRNGPGTRYPIQWVYKRRDLPVRVEREFDVWRLVEDMDGVKGWVNQATLVGTRTFVVLPAGGAGTRTPGADATDQGTGQQVPRTAPTGANGAGSSASAPLPADTPGGGRVLRAAASDDAAAVAILQPGVIGRLRTCQAGSAWCKVSLKTVSGWLRRDAMWGLAPDEAIGP
ncbi:SH3 domain-containing protein [Rhizosaccharibacter radicis]|uniref:SH3 domain-containing protein n=1 Tax=Rhizosaccharibacter radicis TaxID=2782605 RepID=A0ABT1W0F0_9PROT|nr:SH3 domain-containing protein [Acetobacteraceae bacterium KSS12]